MLNTIREALEDRKLAWEEQRCVCSPIGCGRPIAQWPFRDALSEKEYKISGLCQTCQDSVFEDKNDSYPDIDTDEYDSYIDE